MYLFKTVIYFLMIFSVFTDDLKHSHYAIDRCTDIMTHSAEEICLGSVCCLCFLKSGFQAIHFFLFTLMKICRIFQKNHSIDNFFLLIAVSVINNIFRHKDCFLHPSICIICILLLIFHSNLFIAHFKTPEKFRRRIHNTVTFLSFFCNLFYPSPAIFVIRTRKFQAKLT